MSTSPVLDISADAAPFAVFGFPNAEPVSDQAIMAAHAQLNELYPDGPLQKRVENSLPLVLDRHQWQFIGPHAVQVGEYIITVPKDGTELHVCKCMDWKQKFKTLNGLCKHVFALETVRIAQAVLPPALATIAIPSVSSVVHMLRACTAAGDSPINVAFDDTFGNWLQISNDVLDMSMETPGTGMCTLTIPADRVAAALCGIPLDTIADGALRMHDDRLVIDTIVVTR